MIPLRGLPSVTLRPLRPWQVIYLYPGVDGRADFQECFAALILEWNAASVFEFMVDLVWLEVDILSTEVATTLLSSVNRARLLAKISTHCDLLICDPAYNTFSRARHSGPEGPPPVRSVAWPRGLPSLAAGHRTLVDEANILMDFMLQAVKTAVISSALVFFRAPEDLGKTRRGTPASVWRWPAALDLQCHALTRGALYFSTWTGESQLRPLGVLTNAASLLEDPAFHQGWPRFDDHGNYIGPLPKLPFSPLRSSFNSKRSRSPAPVVNKSRAGTMKVAGHLFQSWVLSASRPAEAGTQVVGECAASGSSPAAPLSLSSPLLSSITAASEAVPCRGAFR